MSFRFITRDLFLYVGNLRSRIISRDGKFSTYDKNNTKHDPHGPRLLYPVVV